MPNVDVGFEFHCWYKFGTSSVKSGKIELKYSSTFSLLSKPSKEFSPFLGANNVHVKLPSKLARAMSINSPLGQICRAFLSNKCVPFFPAGINSSL